MQKDLELFREATTTNLNTYFKIDGKPAGNKMSVGQIDIVSAIVHKIAPRAACLAPTGYGKSEAVAMGVILAVFLHHDDFIIGSVKFGTSDIIMKKIIEHIFDNSHLIAQMEIDSQERLSSLKRERKKQSINFKDGGGIKIISLYGTDRDVSTAIGEHVPNIILDESPLLTPAKYLIILKMLEGTGDYDHTFLFELGNALNRNHFMQNIKYNPKYLKIDVSLDQALAEGRLDAQSVDEKRGLPFFEQFYLCKFPSEDEIDERGYRQIISIETIESKQASEFESDKLTPMKLGVDIGGGGDFNVYVIRQGNRAWIECFNRSDDTMTNVNEIKRIIDKYTISVNLGTHWEKKRLLVAEEVYIDDIGIGRGVSDRLRELNIVVNDITVGSKSREPDRYANQKADYYWRTQEWLRKDDIELLASEHWQQVAWIKYKESTDKVLKIEPKEDLKKRVGRSPDFAEAFMLTFADRHGQADFKLI